MIKGFRMSDQFTPEQRTFMALEYHKVRDTPNCIKLVRELFAQKFPGVRVPHRNNVRKVWKNSKRNSQLSSAYLVNKKEIY